MHLTPEATKELLVSRLRYLCDTVDGLPLRRQQKIKVYKLYVCPGMSWLLGLLDLPLSWIERKLDSVPTRFLKKWCGLAATTNPSIFKTCICLKSPLDYHFLNCPVHFSLLLLVICGIFSSPKTQWYNS